MIALTSQFQLEWDLQYLQEGEQALSYLNSVGIANSKLQESISGVGGDIQEN